MKMSIMLNMKKSQSKGVAKEGWIQGEPSKPHASPAVNK